MSNKLTVNESPNKILVNVNEDGEVFVEVLQGNLTVNGSMGAGDVVGPASSTDNAIVRFNGTDGKLIQNSGITIADGATGTLSGTNSGDVTVTDTATIDLTISGQALSGAVRTQQSITSDASGIKLSGDSASPGNSRYYGTDGGGSKGFHVLPVGTVTSVGVAGTDGIEVDSGSPVTGSGTITLGVNAATMKTTLDLAGTNTGDQNIFSTIAVSGQSNVVADTTSDTLTLVAGSNVTITTDAATDTITISSTDTNTGITQLTGDVTAGPGSGSQTATIANDAVTFAKMQNISSDHLIGRHSSGSGDPQQIGVGSSLAISGANLERAALTGDVTASSGSNTTTIANNAVTYAKIQDVSAASRLLGRGSASGAGDAQEITLGTNLSMSGTTLNATGGGGIGGSTGAADNAILRADGTGGSTLQASLVEIADSGMVSSPTGFEVVPADSTNWRSQLVGNRLELYRDDGLGVTSNIFLVGTELSATGTLALTNPDATGTREILLDGVAEFTQLADTPASYTGQSGKVVAVKGTEDGLEFITAGGGSIGGTVGTVDNAIPKANGTGGSTLQGSDVSITDAGEVKFADGVNGGAGQSLGGLIAGNGGASSTANAGGGGGYVYMIGGAADSTGTGGDAGSLFMLGGDASSGNGAAAGNINTSASFGLSGGSILTASGGGSINTTGSGSIQLGSAGTRTTILGAAASDWNLTLPTGMGNLGEVLTTNGSGTTSWAIPTEATAALGLKTATTTVSVSAATAPTAGQVLTATSGTAATWQTLSGGSVGGSDTQVQFNDGGVFGGDAGLTYNKTTDTLTAGVFSGSGASLTTLNASNLSSGTVASARLPTPTTGAIGGVMRNTGSAGQFVSGIAANGELQYGSPAGGLANITETLNTSGTNITVNAEQLAVTGGTTNVNLVLTPRGTGGFMLGGPPDGTGTGGNIIGVRAVDLQLSHGTNTRVASGENAFAAGTNNTASGLSSSALGSGNTSSGSDSFTAGFQNIASSNQGVAMGNGNTSSNFTTVAIGRTNNATGSRSVAIGINNTASATTSVAIGEEANSSASNAMATGLRSGANRLGMWAHAAGQFAANGDAQAVTFVARNRTTTNSAVTLFLDGSSTRLTVPSGRILHLQITLLGSSSDGVTVASYMRQVTIKNVAGTTSLVGTVNTIGVDEAAGTSIAITADDTNDALQIAVTGITSETWRWVAVAEGVEIAFGA